MDEWEGRESGDCRPSMSLGLSLRLLLALFGREDDRKRRNEKRVIRKVQKLAVKILQCSSRVCRARAVNHYCVLVLRIITKAGVLTPRSVLARQT